MSTLSKKLMTGAALTACLILTAPAITAQRGGNNESAQEAEARRRTATEQERTEAEARHRREVEENTRKEREAAERRKAAGEHAKPADDESKVKRGGAEERRMSAGERDKAMKKIRGEEERHRDHLARIHRLRKLAEDKGQTERLAALDKLEGKENERYAAQVVRRKSALGERMHRGVEEHLKKGRGHDKDGKARGAKARKKFAHEKDAEAKKQKEKNTQAERRDNAIKKKKHEDEPNDNRGGDGHDDDDDNGRDGERS